MSGQSPEASPPELLPLPSAPVSEPLSAPPELLPLLDPLLEPLLLPLLEPLLLPLLDPLSSPPELLPLSVPLPELLPLLLPPDDEELHPPTTPRPPSAMESTAIPIKRWFISVSLSSPGRHLVSSSGRGQGMTRVPHDTGAA